MTHKVGLFRLIVGFYLLCGINKTQGVQVAFSPVKFLQDVRAEAKRVTWPGRRATLTTTGAVVGMAAFTSLFFFCVDQLIGFGVRTLFGLGG
ncbi:MAG: preprotein translocase subunit SecE [Acetobacter sp.]|jgi:preprotein translocase subunit SecE|nr:preprotein translocase subunit SecE [Acetobacter sp.]MCH4060316.1 preprotein translocase subunit SecE [Acetobacter sp.]MCH4087256.1 preprotein translocase subunit SecE [Acetobacter sp.]MCI1293077.1 preprotein translocase subunit SecE [Acetobacter sp.]MCI1319663.1 preprotein translocase subunit SecE [Acetobacter sp.]